MWKHSTVIPIPKKSTTKELNDIRPVALTSLMMKAMERIVKQHVIPETIPLIDFAFCTSRGIDDAKIFIPDTLNRHLELPNSSAIGAISPLHSTPFSLTSWPSNSPPVFTWTRESWSTSLSLIYATPPLALHRAVSFPCYSSSFTPITADLHNPTLAL